MATAGPETDGYGAPLVTTGVRGEQPLVLGSGMAEHRSAFVAVARHEHFLSALFGAASGLLAMGFSTLLPDGWPTGIALIGLAVLLLSLYVVLFADAHPEVEALQSVRHKRQLFLTVALVFCCAALVAASVGVQRDRRMRLDLVDMIKQGEDLKEIALSRPDAPFKEFETWTARVLEKLVEYDLAVCLVDFRYPPYQFTFHHGKAKENEDVWNSTNKRTVALAECLRNLDW